MATETKLEYSVEYCLYFCCWKQWSQHMNPDSQAPEHVLLLNLCVVTTSHKLSKMKLRISPSWAEKMPPGLIALDALPEGLGSFPSPTLMTHSCL